MSRDATITKGERTRAEIIEAAYSLFLERGYNGTSMRQIAEKAGIALGGIYNHFAGKEDIFAAVFEERHPYLQILPILDAAQGDSLEAMLHDVAHHVLEVLNERPDFLNLMFIEMIEFQGSHLPGFIERALPRLSTFVVHFEQIQAREKLRPVPTVVILRALVGMFASYVISEHFLNRIMIGDKAESLSYFIDIFLHGVIQPVETGSEPHTFSAAQNGSHPGAP